MCIRDRSIVDKFDGLGIGIFNKISAIDIDNCIDASGNYSDLAKDIMAVSYTHLDVYKRQLLCSRFRPYFTDLLHFVF